MSFSPPPPVSSAGSGTSSCTACSLKRSGPLQPPSPASAGEAAGARLPAGALLTRQAQGRWFDRALAPVGVPRWWVCGRGSRWQRVGDARAAQEQQQPPTGNAGVVGMALQWERSMSPLTPVATWTRSPHAGRGLGHPSITDGPHHTTPHHTSPATLCTPQTHSRGVWSCELPFCYWRQKGASLGWQVLGGQAQSLEKAQPRGGSLCASCSPGTPVAMHPTPSTSLWGAGISPQRAPERGGGKCLLRGDSSVSGGLQQ